MNEALICLRERRRSKLVQAFFEMAQAGVLAPVDEAGFSSRR
jgi:hypothetical protein